MFSRYQNVCHWRARHARNRAVLLVALLVFSGGVNQALAQYAGPSILSRGGNRPGQRGRAPIDFAFYAAGRGTYETGLLRPLLNDQGEIVPQDTFGVSTELGVYGGRTWRRTQLGLDYRGDYRYNNKISYFNGTNQAIALQLEHRLTRRILMSFSQTGGTSNRAFGAFSAPAFGDTNRLGVPLNELFDVRMYYLQSNATATWQRSARMALSGGADVFFVKRRSLSLINAQGMRALGGVSYRTSRRNTLLGGYQFLRFEFPRIYAHSDIHGVSAGVQNQLTRDLQIRFVGGLYMATSRGVEQVTLSPEVAAILGRTTGVAAFRRTSRFPLIEAEIAHTQQRGRFFVGGSSSASPGNGVLLTARRTNVQTGYSYTGIRRTSLGVSAGYISLKSEALQLRNNTGFQAGVGMSYRLAESLDFTSQLDYRRFEAGENRARRGFAFLMGLSFTTSRFPISIW